MDKQSIKQAIIGMVGSSPYTSWTIGLTHVPDERKQQHENDGESTKYWKEWTADSLSDAREIETYFINEKNMKGGVGGDLDSYRTVYVYIF